MITITAAKPNNNQLSLVVFPTVGPRIAPNKPPKENNIALVTIGADYTLPIATGIMLMTESMLVKDYQIDSNSTQTALMASVPLGMVYQLMFISQFNWEEKKNYNFLRLTATYDQYALNFIISINPKRSDYNEAAYFLPNTVAGFGTNLKFVFMYNH